MSEFSARDCFKEITVNVLIYVYQMSIIVLSIPKTNRNPNDDMKRTRRILGYVATDCSCRVIILGIETQLLVWGGGVPHKV